jgi:undecaprenyl-diphosphatase
MNPVVLSGQTSFFATFLASVLIWLMFAGLLVLWVVDGRIKREQALHALLASFLAWGVSEMIKSLLPIPRPYQVNGTLPMTLTIPFDSTFPSGHAAAAFGLATSIWLHEKKLGYVFILIACLVGFGRIISNVHYTSDVLAGIMVGIAIAFLTDRVHLFKLVTKKKGP